MAPRQTRLAVIGDPIAHSLSPEMQNAALRDLGLPYVYNKIRVRPQNLRTFMKTKAATLGGFNCTLPHKEGVIPHLDWISPHAKMIGAVNTVVCRKGKFFGFNTDGAGYRASLFEATGFQIHQKHVVLMGAGGASRALAVALATSKVKQITLCNRTSARANSLEKNLKKFFPKLRIQISPLMGPAFHKSLKSADLLINTTTVGMGHTQWADFPYGQLPKRALVSDIVYTPRMTDLLKGAKRHGLAIHTGEGMLVHQGALAFLLWTGRLPDTRLMRRVLLNSLKKKK